MAVSLPLQGADLKPEDIYSAVSPSIVALDVETVSGGHFVGTAFLAMEDRIAVTAWHVVHDARRVEARFSDNRRVKVVGFVDKNEKSDLALIELQTGGRPRIELCSAAPRVGSRVYLVGSPRGFDFSIGEGLVSQIRTLDGVQYYQLSCPISPGNSGGPVLNEHGQAIGVVSWRKADAENLGFAVPSPVVARLRPALPLVHWSDHPAASHPPGGQPERSPLVRADAADAGPGIPHSYAEFLQFLSARAGERLTVTIREQHGHESQFIFDVPRKAQQ